MAPTREVMSYLCLRYPHKSELSKARLTKMVYLADWKFALDKGRQITSINWVFNHFGPYVSDVEIIARDDPAFRISQTTNVFGNRKDEIALANTSAPIDLSDDERSALDHVINETKSLNWDGFIKLVYSTFPVRTGLRGSRLDLVNSAQKYRELEELLA